MSVSLLEKNGIPPGNQRRLAHIAECIIAKAASGSELTVLDVGCGTGELMTLPLAEMLTAHPNVKLHGIDVDAPSIERATANVKERKLTNVSFAPDPIEDIAEQYDIVMLLMVLEHVEDPEHMIAEIKKRVKPGGIFILSIPNGYGPYEIESATSRFLQRIPPLVWLGAIPKTAARFVFTGKLRAPKAIDMSGDAPGIKETLNDPNNHHIQFFTTPRVKKMLNREGLRILEIIRTEFMCGPYSNQLIHPFPKLERLNYKAARKLPVWLASDWTYICQLEEAGAPAQAKDAAFFEALYNGPEEPWRIDDRASQTIRYTDYLRMLSPILTGNEHVLDIGCSTGHFTRQLARHVKSITAIDISPTAIATAQAGNDPKNITYAVGALPKLAYADSSFDLVLPLEVLYYLSPAEQEEALREMKRVTKPGGHVLLSVNIGNKPYYSLEELEALVSAEFKIVDVQLNHGRIYASWEQRLMAAEPLAPRITRKLLKNKAMVRIGRGMTKSFMGERGVTMAYALLQRA